MTVMPQNKAFVEAVRDAGIVGEGGAGFPSHVKYAAGAETVIANGCECEPLLHTDHHILADFGEHVARGLAALAASCGATRRVLALKKKHTDIIPRLREQMAVISGEVFLLDDFYPAGDEQVLVREVTGKSVPPLGIPLQVGVIVTNVGTLADVDAALGGAGCAPRPLTAKFLTVTGDVGRPGIVRAPLGTPLAECLEMCGGVIPTEPVFILGGPMMGRVVEGREALAREYVTKTSGGLITLPAGHPLHSNARRPVAVLRRRAASACIQCRACSDLCPRRLLGHHFETHRVMRAFAAGAEAGESAHIAAMCCECGACEHYACPMGMSPRRINQAVKAAMRGVGATYQGSRELCEGQTLSRAYRKIPTRRLAARLGLAGRLDTPTPYLGDVTPRVVTLPLRQHIGVPSVPVVAPGDSVTVGQCIAEIPENALGARVHASISGTVVSIDGHIAISAR